MSKPKLANYLSGAILRLRQAASDELHAMSAYRSVVFSGPAPFLHKPWPERPHTPDFARGEEIAKGVFRLAGKNLSYETVSDLWAQASPSRSFATSLHQFCWLADLEAFEDDQQAAELARQHVDVWIEQYGKWNRFSWDKAITAKRCLAWLGASRMLFSGDAVASSTRLDSLGKQLRHLKSVINVCEAGENRLWIAIALATAGTCLYGMKGLQKTGLSLLQKELEQQILPDGGHVGRNPQTAALFLLELDALSALLQQHDRIVPAFLYKTKDRLQPFVRFCTMLNGDLIQFNSGGVGDKPALFHTLSPPKNETSPFLIAPHSNYHRLQTKNSVLLLDCGGSPPLLYARNAHAGALSFEFGTEEGALVTNCGWSDCLGDKWREPSRTSAAHSTLIIDDVSSSQICSKGISATFLGTVVYDREANIPTRRTEEDAGVWLNASHQEYVSRYGLQHNRRLFLGLDGVDLRGEDTLERPIGFSKTKDLQPIPFTIRFHLHPNVQASLTRNNSNVLLRLPCGEGWRFRCDRSEISLEPSVYLGAGAPPRRSSQIVITGAADPNGTGQESSNRTRWSLRRIESDT